ncbi:Vegetative incompatibility protein HET-E-1 [Lachnellula suecica]|uniref:Vegetative incompatibility protein HET-E-1 n=1 Tax=Lachnellula suecica TaxID=602035 RepID=A0A8T9CEH6_9HELO|nr:Vegetative incompatibility protein HET-E-1 [Lachnellula suecica]
MAWLGSECYYAAHHHATARRTPGTGQWLLDDSAFEKWLSGFRENDNSGILWLRGAPGTGKSILCSTVIEHLQQHNNLVPTAYFYYDSQNSSQVSMESLSAVPTIIIDAYQLARRYGRSTASAADKIPELLRSVIENLPSVNIIVDALDECKEVEKLSTLLCTAARCSPSLHLMVFSRDTLEVQKELEQVPSMRLDASRIQQDIDRYLEDAVKSLPCSKAQIRERTFMTLSQKADGMFLFAYLGVQTLESAVNVCGMLEALENLPLGLGNVYGLILDRLAMETSARRNLAQRIFLWVCGAVRPLAWPELQCALSWDPERRIFDPSQAPFKNVVLKLCSPLVDHRTETDTFHLTHLSVYEFLREPLSSSCVSPLATCFLFDEGSSHLHISETTLAYLQIDEISNAIQVDDNAFPLCRYSTDNWGVHLSSASFNITIRNQYKNFVSDPERRLNCIARSLVSEHWPFPLQRIRRIQSQVRQWEARSVQPGTAPVDDIIDIQKALFLLDNLEQSKNSSTSRFDMEFIRELAREYTMSGNLEIGIDTFEKELAKVEENEVTFSESKSWFMNSLAILYDQQGKIQDAEKIQHRALSYLEQNLPDGHLSIIMALNDLGRICRHLKKYDECEVLHRRALEKLQKEFPEDVSKLNWTKNTLGRCLLQTGRRRGAGTPHPGLCFDESTVG